MEEQFFMGIKNTMHNLVKQLLIVILTLAIICTILIKCLFSYYENYIQRQEARVIYEIRPTTVEVEARSGNRKYMTKM